MQMYLTSSYMSGQYCKFRHVAAYEMFAEHVALSFIAYQQDVQPTRLSLACATTKKREKDNRMAGHDKSAIWDEVQEEADELAHVHKDPHAHNVSLLSAGTSKSISLHLP